MKKIWILGMSLALSTALFTGCASNADTLPQTTPEASTAPAVTAAPTDTVGPAVTVMPNAADPSADMGGGVTGAGANTVEDALRVSQQVSEEVEKLSELDSAKAVVTGSIALVGVSYDAQYQGGLTDRVREMVTERVELIDKTVTTVHVTDDEEAVRKIETLYERLKDGDISFAELQTEVLDVASGITKSPTATAGTSAGQK